MEVIAVAVIASVLVVAVALSAFVRTVPSGHVGVVLRGARVVRSRPVGVLLLLPGLESFEAVPVHPSPIEPLSVVAQTRDGVDVRLVLSVLWRVSDPTKAAAATQDVRLEASDSIERALRRLVAEVELGPLLRDRQAFVSRLPVAAGPLLAPVGVELTDVDLLDAEVWVGAQLLRLLA